MTITPRTEADGYGEPGGLRDPGSIPFDVSLFQTISGGGTSPTEEQKNHSLSEPPVLALTTMRDRRERSFHAPARLGLRVEGRTRPSVVTTRGLRLNPAGC